MNGKITGEATPYYLFHPMVPQRMYNVLPNAKLIILLRNPVDRAFSHYKHEVRRGNESLSFEEALKKEEVRLDGELKKIRENKEYQSINHQSHSYLSRGIYINQIKRWFNFFSGNQILILKSEDLFNNPSETYKRVLGFLGLRKFDLPDFKNFNYDPKKESMNPDTRKRLIEFFKPHNRRLYEYLGVDFRWETE